MSFIFLVVDKALVASFIEAADDKETRSKQCHELGKKHISVKTIPVRKYMGPDVSDRVVVERFAFGNRYKEVYAKPADDSDVKMEDWRYLISVPFDNFVLGSSKLYRSRNRSDSTYAEYQRYDGYGGWVDSGGPGTQMWVIEADLAKVLEARLMRHQRTTRPPKDNPVKLTTVRFFVDDVDSPDIMFRVNEFSDAPDLHEWISRHNKEWTTDEGDEALDPEYWTELTRDQEISRAFKFIAKFWEEKKGEEPVPEQKEKPVFDFGSEVTGDTVAKAAKDLWTEHRDKRIKAAEVLDKAVDDKAATFLKDLGVPRTVTAALLDLKDRAIEELKK